MNGNEIKEVFGIKLIGKKLQENGITEEYRIINDDNEILLFSSYEDALEAIKSEIEAEPGYIYSVEKYYAVLGDK